MRVLLALFSCLILVQCEWRDSWLSLLSSTACCETSCCIAQPGSPDDACDDETSNPVKQCCKTCAYYPPVKISITYYEEISELIFQNNHLSFPKFAADRFQPPEGYLSAT